MAQMDFKQGLVFTYWDDPPSEKGNYNEQFFQDLCLPASITECHKGRLGCC